MKRVLDVVRIQALNWPATFGWPVGIMGITFAINLAIFAVIGEEATGDGSFRTGAVVSIYLVMLIAHQQTMTQYFPLAIGLSVTRRTYFWAAAVVILAESAVLGLLLVVLHSIERATGGWGIDLTFYDLGFLTQDNLVAQWAVYGVPFLAVCAIGLFLGVVLKRWGPTGMYVTVITAALAVAAAVLLVTWREWWEAVGSFFTDQSPFTLLAGYPVLVALALGGASFLAIRRATP